MKRKGEQFLVAIFKISRGLFVVHLWQKKTARNSPWFIHGESAPQIEVLRNKLVVVH
jgi:hypothetical protein